MAGGQGTRFWPWSKIERPKQFLSLMSEESMLQQTYNRFSKWLPREKIYIVTTEEYVSLVKEQLPFINENHIIVEPFPRDTGPCMALTAIRFLEDKDNEVFVAVPADHYLFDDQILPEIFDIGEKLARKDNVIVTLGIKPTRPETGYGYIHAENVEKGNIGELKVKSFIEKPDEEKAERLLKSENIYWNSGMFFWKPSTIGYYMEKFQPEIWDILKNDKQNIKTQYALVPKISVDYAILEKAESIYTIPVNLKWDDIGNWTAWERLNKNSNENNYVQGDVHLLSTNNCVIKSEHQKVVVIGVEDLIIASTKEGLLVCHKSQEQKIKDVLKGFVKENE